MLAIALCQLPEDSIAYQLYRIEQLFHTVEDIWNAEGDNILRLARRPQNAGKQRLTREFIACLLKRGCSFCNEARQCVYTQSTRHGLTHCERQAMLDAINDMNEVFGELHELMTAIELPHALLVSKSPTDTPTGDHTNNKARQCLFTTIQSCLHSGSLQSTQAITHMQQVSA